jgi:hypothetical protein
MSSIIEGYNYDIFNSYRLKDNKERGGEKEMGRWGDFGLSSRIAASCINLFDLSLSLS